jgi:hypothetical protein
MTKSEKTETDHMAMWNRLMPTNPKYTKAFDRGGFKGTATNGTYIVQRLTEEFGPCGVGWVFVLEEERIIHGHALKSGDNAQLHIVRGHIRYSIDGTYWDTSPQFGQTMLVGENKYGTFTDEEAPKKSITDAISKCAVLLGIAADVHLGLFDDSKYVNDRRKEEAADATPAKAPDPSEHHKAPAATEAKAAVAEQVRSDATDDKTIARQVFYLVKGTAEKATDARDIDDILKYNAASLKVLERFSATNYETLKAVVKEARERIAKLPKNDPSMNDDLPEFEDMGR